MIQVYQRKKETCLIPSSEYASFYEEHNGVKFTRKITEDGRIEFTLDGTHRSNAFYLFTDILGKDQYGTNYYMETDLESDRSQIYFGAIIFKTEQTSTIPKTMTDGEKEMWTLLPEEGGSIAFGFGLENDCTFHKKTFTIGVYYDDGTKDDPFEQNGDMTLLPTEAKLHVILNSTWEATLEHPIDEEGRWKYIQEEAVVKLPSFYGKDQLFRIKQKEKSDSGISATLEPIFYDSRDDCFLVDVRPTNKNGQDALNLMTAPNSKYQGKSDITNTATAYYQFKNLMEAVNGDDENSFINRWGGEILFDDYQVIINERVGGDYGLELRYGKNIPQDGLTEEVDIREVVTRIYPKAYNGYTMTNNGSVDSPLIDNYPTIKIRTITFSDVKMREDASEDDEENGVILCDTQADLDAALKKRCKEQYEAGLDKPKVTISADMVLLKDTELYKEYAVLEDVSLGDTIHCRNSHLGIVTDARVIELEWDCIQKKVDSVVLGDFQYNYFNDVDSAVNRIDGAIRPDGSLVAEKISGFINGAMASLRAQASVAKKVGTRAILFEDLDTDSPTYGALAIGTQGLEIACERTEDKKDWAWTTAITGQGAIATILVAGLLSDKKGKNFWNLDTGQVQFTVNKEDNSKIQAIDAEGEIICEISYNGIMAIAGMIGGWEITKEGLQSTSNDGNTRVIFAKYDPTEKRKSAIYVQKKGWMNKVVHQGDGYEVSLEFDWETLARIDYDGSAWFTSRTYKGEQTENKPPTEPSPDRNFIHIKDGNIAGGTISPVITDGKIETITEYYISRESEQKGIGLEIGTTETAQEKGRGGIRLQADKYQFGASDNVGKSVTFNFLAPKSISGGQIKTYRDAMLEFKNGLLVDWSWEPEVSLE